MASAWRFGLSGGAVLFVLALLGAGVYFVPHLSDGGIARVTDLEVVLSSLIFLEVGRRSGFASGEWAAAPLAGAVAGFMAALAGLPLHALLSASPRYPAYLAEQVGANARYLTSGGMAVAMAGLLGSVGVTAVWGGLLAALGGAVGRLARVRRGAAGGRS